MVPQKDRLKKETATTMRKISLLKKKAPHISGAFFFVQRYP